MSLPLSLHSGDLYCYMAPAARSFIRGNYMILILEFGTCQWYGNDTRPRREFHTPSFPVYTRDKLICISQN